MFSEFLLPLALTSFFIFAYVLCNFLLPFLSFPFLSFPFLSFPFLSFIFCYSFFFTQNYNFALLQSIKTEDPVEYSQNLIDIQSSAFRKTLLILLASLGAAFVLGIIWNFTCRCRNSTKRKKGKRFYVLASSFRCSGLELM